MTCGNQKVSSVHVYFTGKVHNDDSAKRDIHFNSKIFILQQTCLNLFTKNDYRNRIVWYCKAQQNPQHSQAVKISATVFH